jgi:uncharacterized protein (DUF58 family)
VNDSGSDAAVLLPLTYPLLAVLLVGGGLVFAAWIRSCFPSPRLVSLFAAAAAGSLLLLLPDARIRPLLIFDGVLLGAAAWDLWRAPSVRSLSATRRTATTASIAAPLDVELRLENRGSTDLNGLLADDYPENCRAEPDRLPFALPARSRIQLHYRLTPMRRGVLTQDVLHLSVDSPWKLWRRQLQVPVPGKINVYPDMQQLAEYALLARTDRLNLIGVRNTRSLGHNHEFERLRDYTLDDNYRHIDWRATARRNRLTVKQYQSDQSQRLIFMLDCGRMMTNQRAGLSLLDHALNATLMLSYVALEQGDSVGLICFSDRVHMYVPPRGGKQHMNRLLVAGFDQFPQFVESRYDLAFMQLSTRCLRRSLVVLVTNVIDDVNAQQVSRYLTHQLGRHLPLAVFLRDRQLFDAAEAGIPTRDRAEPGAGQPGAERPTVGPTTDQLYRAAAAADILIWRQQVLTDLVHRGVLALDLFPEDMTAPLINEYLQIKARHLL